MLKRWFVFGVHGLLVTDDDVGFEKPLFGDATIVSRDFLLGRLAEGNPATAARVAAIAGVEELIDALGPSSVPHREQSVRQPPNSFVAVLRTVPDRDQAGYDEAAVRADEVTSMLAIAHALGTRTMETFAGSDIAKAQSPVAVVSQSRFTFGGKFDTARSRFIRTARLLEPLPVKKSALRDAWKHGSMLSGHGPAKWSLGANEPLYRILASSKRTPFERRIADAAGLLYRAMHALTNAQQLVGAVTSLETIFVERSNFDQMSQRIHALGLKGVEPSFKLRHDVVHAGVDVDPDTAAAALGAAGLALYATAANATMVQGVEQFRRHLDFLSSARTLGEYWTETQTAEFFEKYGLLGPVPPGYETL